MSEGRIIHYPWEPRRELSRDLQLMLEASRMNSALKIFINRAFPPGPERDAKRAEAERRLEEIRREYRELLRQGLAR